MDEIIEIEDIVGKTYQNAILERFTAKDFPWYLNKNLVSPDMFTGNSDKDINPLGWNHFLYEENKVEVDSMMGARGTVSLVKTF